MDWKPPPGYPPPLPGWDRTRDTAQAFWSCLPTPERAVTSLIASFLLSNPIGIPEAPVYAIFQLGTGAESEARWGAMKANGQIETYTDESGETPVPSVRTYASWVYWAGVGIAIGAISVDMERCRQGRFGGFT